MRVGFPGGPRLEWYDRNPLFQLFSTVAGGGGPFSKTLLWTYTVPTGKKALIEFLFTRCLRSNAATAVGRSQCYVEITPSGGSAKKCLSADIITNNIGDRDTQAVGQGGILLTGDAVKSYYEESSSAGFVEYFANAKLTEFDD